MYLQGTEGTGFTSSLKGWPLYISSALVMIGEAAVIRITIKPSLNFPCSRNEKWRTANRDALPEFGIRTPLCNCNYLCITGNTPPLVTWCGLLSYKGGRMYVRPVIARIGARIVPNTGCLYARVGRGSQVHSSTPRRFSPLRRSAGS